MRKRRNSQIVLGRQMSGLHYYTVQVNKIAWENNGLSLYIMALRKNHADEEHKVLLLFLVLRHGMHGKKQVRNKHVLILASLPRV
jgi:hypothetical protein